jgi:hypothetical protein
MNPIAPPFRFVGRQVCAPAGSLRWIVLASLLVVAVVIAGAFAVESRVQQMPQRPPDQAIPLGPARLTSAGLEPARLAPLTRQPQTRRARQGPTPGAHR